jgi:hypothetical protein
LLPWLLHLLSLEFLQLFLFKGFSIQLHPLLLFLLFFFLKFFWLLVLLLFWLQP